MIARQIGFSVADNGNRASPPQLATPEANQSGTTVKRFRAAVASLDALGGTSLHTGDARLERKGPDVDYPFRTEPGLALDPRYAELREKCPVAKVDLPHNGPAWLITGYPESRAVLADPRFSRALATDPDTPRFTPRPLPAGMLQNLDPPDHTRLRRVVAQAFTAHQVNQLRPRVEELTGELLDDVRARGAGADLVEMLAFPLPLRVICELLGVPYADRAEFRKWSDAFLSTTALSAAEVERAAAELYGYIRGLVERQRAHPTDTLLGKIVRTAADVVSEVEMVMLGVVVLVGGYETTACQIANSLHVLLSDPARYERLRGDLDLLPHAVAELMRFIPLGSAGSFPRVATEDVTIGGVTIKAGDAVVTHAGAANRDPRVFPRADELDLAREDNPHLGFGHGAHHCLGSRLAVVELQVVLRSVLTGFPALRLAVPEEEIPWRMGTILRAPTELAVTW
jgi:cytochrome P450